MTMPVTRKKYDKKVLKSLLAEIKGLMNQEMTVDQIATYLNTKTFFKPANSPEFNKSNVSQLILGYRLKTRQVINKTDTAINNKFKTDSDALRSLVLTATLSAQTKVDILMALEKVK